MDKKEDVNKVRYFCRYCNYKFSRNKNFSFPKACPYCDKDGVEILKIKSAQELIKESEKHGLEF